MADTRGIKAGRAYVELGIGDKLSAGLKRAQARLAAFGAGAMKLGVMVATPLLLAAKTFASMGDDIAKMARRTGLAVEALSELRFVASQSGTDIASLENGLRRMQRTIYDAGRGLSTATDALADLGLTLKDIERLSPEDQFKTMAEALSKVEDPTRKAAIAMTIFGRSGTELLPMLEKGAAGIEALQKKARSLGLTMSQEDAMAAEKFTDAMDVATSSIKMAAFHLGASLAPQLHKALEWIKEIVPQITAWIRQNQQLIVTILKASAALVAIGAAAIVIGKLIGAVTIAIKVIIALKLALIALGGPLAIVTVAVGLLAAGWLAVEMAAMRAQAAMERITEQTKRLGDIGEEIRELQRKIKDGPAGQVADLQKLVDLEKERLAIYENQLKIAQAWETETEKKPTRFTGGYTDKQRREAADKVRDEQTSYDWAKKRVALAEQAVKTAKAGLPPTGRADTEDGKTKMEELDARIHRLKIEQIEDEHKRELALIDERYDKEWNAAKGHHALLVKIAEAKILEMEAADKKALQRKAAAEKAIADKRADEQKAIDDANKSQTETNAELKLRVSKKGFDLDIALLALQRKLAMEATDRDGTRFDLVQEEFDLRKQLLDQAQAAATGLTEGMQTAVRGGVGATAAGIQALQADSPMQQIAEKSEKHLEQIEKSNRKIMGIIAPTYA